MKFIVNGKSASVPNNEFQVDFFDSSLNTDDDLTIITVSTSNFKEGVELTEGTQYSGFINRNGILVYVTGTAEAINHSTHYMALLVQSYQDLQLPAIPKIPYDDDRQYILRSNGSIPYWADEIATAFFICYRYTFMPDNSDYLDESVSVPKADNVTHGVNFYPGYQAHVLWHVVAEDQISIDYYLGSYMIEDTSEDEVQLTRIHDLIKLSNSASNTVEEGTFLHIIFNRYLYQKEYTVTLLQDDGNPGDEVYTGTVPADLNVYVSVKQPNATYRISCNNASKTVVSGDHFGEVKSVNLQNYMVILVDPNYKDGGVNAFVQWGENPRDTSSMFYDDSYQVLMCNIPNPGPVHIRYMRFDGESDHLIEFDAFIKDEETTIIVPSAPPESITMTQVNEAIDSAILGAINASY